MSVEFWSGFEFPKVKTTYFWFLIKVANKPKKSVTLPKKGKLVTSKTLTLGGFGTIRSDLNSMVRVAALFTIQLTAIATLYQDVSLPLQRHAKSTWVSEDQVSGSKYAKAWKYSASLLTDLWLRISARKSFTGRTTVNSATLWEGDMAPMWPHIWQNTCPAGFREHERTILWNQVTSLIFPSFLLWFSGKFSVSPSISLGLPVGWTLPTTGSARDVEKSIPWMKRAWKEQATRMEPCQWHVWMQIALLDLSFYFTPSLMIFITCQGPGKRHRVASFFSGVLGLELGLCE